MNELNSVGFCLKTHDATVLVVVVVTGALRGEGGDFIGSVRHAASANARGIKKRFDHHVQIGIFAKTVMGTGCMESIS